MATAATSPFQSATLDVVNKIHSAASTELVFKLFRQIKRNGN